MTRKMLPDTYFCRSDRARVPGQPLADRARTERVDAVEDRADRDEDRTQHQHLRPDRPGLAVQELREERDEEDRRLGVGDAHEEGVTERAPGVRDGRAVEGEVPLAAELPDRQPDEVCRAGVLHDREGQDRGADHRGQAERRRDHHHRCRRLDAGHRGDGQPAAALADAPRDEEQHRRTGQQDEGGRREGERREGGRGRHTARIASRSPPGQRVSGAGQRAGLRAGQTARCCG